MKITPWNKGKKMSKEIREKLSESHKGHKHSIETKNKMSKAKAGKLPNNFKGRIVNPKGYVLIYHPNHPYAVNVYVPEHRLIIEKHIKRFLIPSEEVHHIGKKDDNRIQMLIAFKTKSAHQRFENGGEVPPEEIIFDGRTVMHQSPLSFG